MPLVYYDAPAKGGVGQKEGEDKRREVRRGGKWECRKNRPEMQHIWHLLRRALRATAPYHTFVESVFEIIRGQMAFR